MFNGLTDVSLVPRRIHPFQFLKFLVTVRQLGICKPSFTLTLSLRKVRGLLNPDPFRFLKWHWLLTIDVIFINSFITVFLK